MKNIINTKFILIASIIITLFLTSCTKKSEINQENQVKNENVTTQSLKKPVSKTTSDLLHTSIQITLYDNGDENLIDECFEIIEHYENILSKSEEKKDTSEIYKLNNSNGEVVTLSDDALECLEQGVYYSKLSNGVFDVTVGALSSLWDFKDGTKAPDKALIEKALPTIDYNNIVINGNDVYLKNPDTVVDLGGIAKGFIADKVAEHLKENGVNSAIINLGGNVLTVGYKYSSDNNDLTKFKIGVRVPEIESFETLGYVEVNDMSVVSSGGYEQYIVDEDTGIMYTHILDVKTGYSVDTDIAQVTIFSEKSVDGDALSTITYELGSEKALEFINNTDNTECIIVKNDGEILFSENVGYEDDKYIKFTKTK